MRIIFFAIFSIYTLHSSAPAAETAAGTLTTSNRVILEHSPSHVAACQRLLSDTTFLKALRDEYAGLMQNSSRPNAIPSLASVLVATDVKAKAAASILDLSTKNRPLLLEIVDLRDLLSAKLYRARDVRNRVEAYLNPASNPLPSPNTTHDLYIVTHQMSNRQADTGLYLQDHATPNDRVLVLVSPSFPAHFDALTVAANEFRFSWDGTIDHIYSRHPTLGWPARVHFFGGNFSHCLCSTLKGLIRQFEASNNGVLDVFFHGSMIYDNRSTLAEQARKLMQERHDLLSDPSAMPPEFFDLYDILDVVENRAGEDFLNAYVEEEARIIKDKGGQPHAFYYVYKHRQTYKWITFTVEL